MKKTISEILQILHEFAPLSLQESYDNSGLLIGEYDRSVERVLISVDVTEEVVDEAVQKHCELIISHHPLIFKGLKKIIPDGHVERTVIKAIKNNIGIAAAHTNLDNVLGGVNAKLAHHLGIEGLSILKTTNNLLNKLVTFCPTAHADKVRHAMFEAGAGHIGGYDSCSYNLEGFGTFRGGDDAKPFVGKKNQLHQEPEQRIEMIVPVYKRNQVIQAMINAHPYEEVAYDVYPLDNTYEGAGAGMIGNLNRPMDQSAFLEYVRDRLHCKILRHSELLTNRVSRVAICGGSGSFLIPDAKRTGADVFITADLKYHDYFEADRKILLIDAGHFETEQFTKELIADIIQKKIPNFAPLISEVNTNAVHYYF